MTQDNGQGGLKHDAAADLWRHTLSQIPSVFGRLVYLCSLRDANTGIYQHFGLAQTFGDVEAGRVLRESHQQIFADWLCFKLQEQKADLDMYFSNLEGYRRTVVETWTRLTPYRNLIPSSAPEADRQLFIVDLEAILDLLRNEYGVASGPDA